jgi:hypothetical protein
MSARKDIVGQAEKVIAEYSRTIGGAYEDALPLLQRALAATYAAAIELLEDPDRLAAFLDARRPGPVSANPLQPIVKKLWRGVQTRVTLHRYSSCLGFARAKSVKPTGFAAWLSSFPGGIKAASASWSRSQGLPDARVRLARANKARTSQLLAGYKPIGLPEDIGARQPGLHLAAIRVSPDGKAELVTCSMASRPQR